MSHWKKRTWLRLASTALIAIMIVGGAASTGAAKDNQPTLSGPSVVTRDTTTLPPLKDVERVILQGKKTESGYAFDFVLHKAADELPKVLRPIAVDPVKGVALVEIGHDPNPTVEPTEGETLAEVAKADLRKKEPSIAATVVSQVTALSTVRSTASFLAQVTDPPGAVVNSVRSTVTWDWDGFRATYVSGNGSLYWLTASGWIEGGHTGPYSASSGDAVRVYYDSAYFFNTVFAATVLGRPAYTDVSYSNITVVGYFDGSRDGYGSAVPGGDLASWLSASYRLE